jgi:phosphoglycolate phosphatase
MPKKIKNIIFDLDGTLIDSAPSILSGFKHVLEINGIEPLIPLTSSLIGPPLIATLRVASGVEDEKKLQQMAEHFKSFYDIQGCLISQPYAAVDDGLKNLVDDGFELHIATNKRLIPTKNILCHLGWDVLFYSVYTLDKVGVSFQSKSNMIAQQVKDLGLSQDKAIYVGDRTDDMEAAQNNQLNFIGVSWGYGDFPKDVTVISTFNQLASMATSYYGDLC